MLAERAVAEPGFERAVFGGLFVKNLVGFGDKAAFQRIRPLGAESGGEIGAQAIRQRLFAGDSRDAEQAFILSPPAGSPPWRSNRGPRPTTRMFGSASAGH